MFHIPLIQTFVPAVSLFEYASPETRNVNLIDRAYTSTNRCTAGLKIAKAVLYFQNHWTAANAVKTGYRFVKGLAPGLPCEGSLLSTGPTDKSIRYDHTKANHYHLLNFGHELRLSVFCRGSNKQS